MHSLTRSGCRKSAPSLSETYLKIVGRDGDARALLDEQRVVADDDERLPVSLGEDVEHHLALGPRALRIPARLDREAQGVLRGDAASGVGRGGAHVVHVLDRAPPQVQLAELVGREAVPQDVTPGGRLEDAEADPLSAGVQVRLDAEVGGGDEAGEAALHDEAGVVGDAHEGRGGANLELGADEVLSVAHPEHDAPEVGAQVAEQDALIIQVLGEYWSWHGEDIF